MNIILVTEAIHLGTWGKFNILVSPMQLRFDNKALMIQFYLFFIYLWEPCKNKNAVEEKKSYLKFRLGKLNKEGEILTVQNETEERKNMEKNRNEI